MVELALVLVLAHLLALVLVLTLLLVLALVLMLILVLDLVLVLTLLLALVLVLILALTLTQIPEPLLCFWPSRTMALRRCVGISTHGYTLLSLGAECPSANG